MPPARSTPRQNVTWYYGEWQSADENLDIPNLNLQEGLPTSFDDDKRKVVVLDDLMAETDGRVKALFTKKSHHPNTTSYRIYFRKTRRVAQLV